MLIGLVCPIHRYRRQAPLVGRSETESPPQCTAWSFFSAFWLSDFGSGVDQTIKSRLTDWLWLGFRFNPRWREDISVGRGRRGGGFGRD